MNLGPVFCACAAVSWLLKYMTLANISIKSKKIQSIKGNSLDMPLKSDVAGASVQFTNAKNNRSNNNRLTRVL